MDRNIVEHFESTDGEPEKAFPLKPESFERHLLHEVPAAVVATDLVGKIVYWNSAATQLHGWTAADAIGSDVKDLIFPHADPGAAVGAVKETLRVGNWAGEVDFRRENGSIFPAFLTLKLLGDRKTGHLVGAIHDFSDRKKLEAQLFQSQKMEALGTMAGGMAHEFNNLLTSILGAANLTREEVGDSPDLLELVETIESAGLRGKQLVSQVLTFSRSDEQVSEVVDPLGIVKDLMQIIGRKLPKDISINTELPSKIPTIMADRSRLVHALLNLCVNSGDAMQEAGALRIEADVSEGIPADSFNPEFELDRQFVKFEVVDDGSGMTAAVLAHARDPFFTTKGRGGTGLGLPLVVSTARAHGGGLRMWSKQGEGTRVALYVPVSGRVVQSNRRSRGDINAYRGTERILVVDDEAIVRRVSIRVLERSGYEVLEAENGVHGLEVLDKHHGQVDLILLDMVMPQMDGSEFFWAVQDTYPEIPILLNSGFSVEGRVGQLLEAGAVGFLKKPYELVELLKSIRGALDGKIESKG
jgi:two-component system, cell cycle sensor histidine kinase and response regulator CckA